MLSKNPGFTAVAVLTLALGIGATTAIVSVVRATLWAPLPVRHPERLVQVWAVRQDGYRMPGLNPRAIEELRQQTNLFQRMVTYERDVQMLAGDGLPERIRGVRVCPEFFSLLNVRPERGRGFTADEATSGRDDVVILSHLLWQRAFGGDPAIVGRSIRFEEGSLTVVGVMPQSFAFPPSSSSVFPEASTTSYWRPLGSRYRPVAMNISVIAELREDTQLRQVQAWLEILQQRLAADQPLDYEEYRFEVQPLRDGFATPFLRRTLWVLLGAIALVLLIASANLANLQFARMATRLQEIAVRAALGAGRWRLSRQLLTESLLLAAVGGLAGLVVAVLGIKWLVELLPPGLPRLKPISLDLGALAVAAGVTLGTGLAFGLLPAWRGGRTSLSAALKLSAATTTRDRRGRWLSRALIAGQVALAVVLLGGAGLMVRSVVALLTVDPGFDPHGVVNFTPQFDADQLPSAAAFETGVRQRVASVPGVEAVGLWFLGNEVEVASGADGRPVRLTEIWVGVEAADPLRVLRVPLKRGRWLGRSDAGGGVVPVLVSESASGRLWPGGDPVGKRLWGTGTNPASQFEVVGVVSDLRMERYDLAPEPTVYRPVVATPEFDRAGTLILRIAAPYAAVQKGIERELKVAGANKARPLVVHWDQYLYDGTAGHRTLMRYLVLFALVGLFLAALGLYGVLAFSVARRTREIGIRLALGARPSDVFLLILSQGMVAAALGAMVGMVGAILGARLLRAFLFGITPQDPLTLIGVALLLSAVALLACWWPARRAARIDPLEALRCE